MAKIGDRIVIRGFEGNEPSARNYIGKTGVVEHIDDAGNIHGTWGGLGLLPEDKYEVLQEGETVHTFEMEGMDTPKVYVLPRQLDDLLSQVYQAGNANCDCTVDDVSYMGS